MTVVMLVLDIFLYIWLGLIFCMCTRLCYEEHQQRHPNTRFNFTYMKRKLSILFDKQEPLILESELTESFHDLETTPPDEPPDWVRGD